MGALGRCQFQPVAGLQRLTQARLGIQATQLQLGAQIAGTRRLAQQFQADTPIPGIAAIAAEQLAEAALRLDHAKPGGLLEHTSSQALDAGTVPQTGSVQQP